MPLDSHTLGDSSSNKLPNGAVIQQQASDDELHDIQTIFKANTRALNWCDSEENFLTLARTMKWAYGNKTAYNICANHNKRIRNLDKIIESLTVCGNPMEDFFALAEENGVWLQGLELKTWKSPQQDNSSAPDKKPTTVMGLKADTLTQLDGEQERPQLMEHITAAGDSICVSGRPGQGKTTHVHEWMRQLGEKGYTSAFFNLDMPAWQAKQRYREAGLKEDTTVTFNLKGIRSITFLEMFDGLEQALESKPEANRKYGIICLDNANKLFQMIWPSVSQTVFDSNSDKCAWEAHDKIITALASYFKCCVVFIGHPGKGVGSKDKYPGSEQWAAEAGIVYRIYRLTNSNYDEIPSGVKGMFKRAGKGSKHSLAHVNKGRYSVENYFLSMDDVLPTIEPVSDELIVEASTPEIDEQEYIESLTRYLADRPNTVVGFKQLQRAKQIPKAMSYILWVGVVVTRLPRKSIRNPAGVYHLTSATGKGQPKVVYIKP